jgi:hypothetical protein
MLADRKAILIRGGGWALAYLSVLLPVVAYAAVRFAALYPPNSLASHPELSQQYKGFVGIAGVGLAVCLGLWAAGFGVWRRSVGQGIFALAVGAVATIGALSAVPWVRFPEDQYPVAALWVMGDSIPLAVAFGVATVAARLAQWQMPSAGS